MALLIRTFCHRNHHVKFLANLDKFEIKLGSLAGKPKVGFISEMVRFHYFLLYLELIEALFNY